MYGTAAQVKINKRILARALRGVADEVQFIDDRKLRWIGRLSPVYQACTGIDLSARLRIMKPVYGMMQGIPSDSQIKSTYWRKPSLPAGDLDPDRDHCGLIWCAPVAPLTGAHAQRLSAIAKELIGPHFEPMVSLTLLNSHTLSCIYTIAYDRDMPGEDAKAAEVYRRLNEKLMEEGYIPYRQATLGMGFLQTGSAYDTLTMQIKQLVDPSNLFASGRYIQGA